MIHSNDNGTEETMRARTKMSREVSREYLEVMQGRYTAAGHRGRTALLDEMETMTGLGRKDSDQDEYYLPRAKSPNSLSCSIPMKRLPWDEAEPDHSEVDLAFAYMIPSVASRMSGCEALTARLPVQ